MPVVNIDLIKDAFTPEQTRQLIERVTEAMIAVKGASLRPVTWVRIEEFEQDDWAIAGTPLKAVDVHPMPIHSRLA